MVLCVAARSTFAVALSDLRASPIVPRTMVYKTAGERKLTLDVYAPPRSAPATQPRSAIVMMHGGGWSVPSKFQLEQHCQYFASRGMVAVNVEYRLVNKAGTVRIEDCIADCRDAFRFVHDAAEKLGIDRNRIVVAGDSAGGHLAAAVAMMTEDKRAPGASPPGAQPVALVAWAPIMDPESVPWMAGHTGVAALPQSPVNETWRDRAARISPLRWVRAGLPPTLVIHGDSDSVVPVAGSDRFVAAMKKAGNRVEYQRIAGWDHVFIIEDYATEAQIVAGLRMTDEFLAGLGLLAGKPTMVEWKAAAFQPLFSAVQAGTPHVRAASRTLDKHAYLDGQWQGMLADSDGDVWFAVSCHDGMHAGQVYRYRPRTDKLEPIADLAAVCGETPPDIGDGVPEGKIHSEMFQDGDTIYCTTTDAHALHARTYSGGYWLAIDRRTAKATSLGRTITGDGLICAGYDPRNKRLYAHTNVKGQLTMLDLATRRERVLGVPQQDVVDAWKADTDPMKPAAIWPRGLALMIAPDGKVYGGKPPGGRLWCYDPATDKIADVPIDMPTPSEVRVRQLHTLRRWRETGLHAARWHEPDQCFYMIRSYDEMLCRFTPPLDGKPAKLETAASLGLHRPHRYGTRHASCALAIHDRTVWYTPYTGWGGVAHLVSYHLDTEERIDHGQLIVEGDRQVAECHALAVTSDGRLYMVAFVYSIDGKDPAQAHGLRDGRPFHPRLLIVDPVRDLAATQPAR